jgi:tRNA-uridine 2-sulfurtransferase
MSQKGLVVAAMSGGVDSSVAAALLVEQGYQVVGMMLRLWSEPGCDDSNRCCTPDAMAQARKVASHLGIPFYAVDARDRFREVVVQHFLDEYVRGDTPNPCVVCNREIRWGFLYEQAMALGADSMATGHYARVSQGADGHFSLRRGLDRLKDQSYVLSVIPQEKLGHSLFPIGGLQKSEVREIARRLGLVSAERPDSQDLCFLAGGDYRGFLQRNLPQTLQTGPILDSQGKVIGQHEGLANYTIGQRKGLRIASARPLYVTGKDVEQNSLRVGEAEQLGADQCWVEDVNWGSIQAPSQSMLVEVKIRYKARDAQAEIIPGPDGRYLLRFLHPLRDITPGQRAVFYQDEVCLGGGTIRG